MEQRNSTAGGAGTRHNSEPPVARSGGAGRVAALLCGRPVDYVDQCAFLILPKENASIQMSDTLYYGDNLEVLDRYVHDKSVDLVYLDPPFKSDENYNVLFKTRDGSRSPAQITAFEDTWRWDQAAARNYRRAVEEGAGRVPEALQAFRGMIGETDMLAYLSMMAPRLTELRRVLKNSGSIFLHCDTAASHYLKLLMDAVFEPENFRNEIIWRNYSQKNISTRFGAIHQSIFFYSKTDDFYFKVVRRPYTREHVKGRYKEDEQGRWKFTTGGNILTGPGATDGESGMEWRGYDPSAKDRHWAIPSRLKEQMPDGFDELGTLEQLERLYKADLIEIKDKWAWPHPVTYLREDDGRVVQDIWAYQPATEGTLHGTDEGIDADVMWIPPESEERLGYPTQKPVGLLKRIVEATCPPDGTVLDPFCGCGTAVAAAEELGREWIGIDVTHVAISLIRRRLNDSFDNADFDVVGEPEALEGAKELAQEDRFQFQYWALDLIDARPAKEQESRGADEGIDGQILFHDEPSADTKQVIISVKSGQSVGSEAVRDLRGVVGREDAEIGVLITLKEPTRAMKKEAASADFYHSPYTNRDHPEIQILTVEELLSGAKIDMPARQQGNFSFNKAPKAQSNDDGKQGKLSI